MEYIRAKRMTKPVWDGVDDLNCAVIFQKLFLCVCPSASLLVPRLFDFQAAAISFSIRLIFPHSWWGGLERREQ